MGILRGFSQPHLSLSLAQSVSVQGGRGDGTNPEHRQHYEINATHKQKLDSVSKGTLRLFVNINIHRRFTEMLLLNKQESRVE